MKAGKRRVTKVGGGGWGPSWGQGQTKYVQTGHPGWGGAKRPRHISNFPVGLWSRSEQQMSVPEKLRHKETPKT